MSRRFNTLDFIVMFANAGGTLLAVFGYSDLIAITVAVASVAMALTDYFYIPMQLTASNRALNEMHNLLLWWDSLSLVQRKRPDAKLRCADVCEGSVLALCEARTSVSSALPSEEGGGEGGGEMLSM